MATRGDAVEQPTCFFAMLRIGIFAFNFCNNNSDMIALEMFATYIFDFGKNIEKFRFLLHFVSQPIPLDRLYVPHIKINLRGTKQLYRDWWSCCVVWQKSAIRLTLVTQTVQHIIYTFLRLIPFIPYWKMSFYNIIDLQ